MPSESDSLSFQYRGAKVRFPIEFWSHGSQKELLKSAIQKELALLKGTQGEKGDFEKRLSLLRTAETFETRIAVCHQEDKTILVQLGEVKKGLEMSGTMEMFMSTSKPTKERERRIAFEKKQKTEALQGQEQELMQRLSRNQETLRKAYEELFQLKAQHKEKLPAAYTHANMFQFGFRADLQTTVIYGQYDGVCNRFEECAGGDAKTPPQNFLNPLLNYRLNIEL